MKFNAYSPAAIAPGAGSALPLVQFPGLLTRTPFSGGKFQTVMTVAPQPVLESASAPGAISIRNHALGGRKCRRPRKIRV